MKRTQTDHQLQQHLVKYLSHFLNCLKDCPDNPSGKKGGYLEIWKECSDGILHAEAIFSVFLGETSDNEAALWDNQQASESSIRLYSKKGDGHRTSFESRNEDEREFAGAVKYEVGGATYYISFAGCEELQNEAMIIKALCFYCNDELFASETFGGRKNLFYSKLSTITPQIVERWCKKNLG